MVSSSLRRLCSVGSLLATSRWATSTANAFSVQLRSSSSSSRLLLSSNSDSETPFSADGNINGSQQKKKKPQTGWNHNLPSESSKFWSTEPGKEDTTSNTQQRKKELRTGWLHNTESPAAKTKSNKSSEPKNPNLARRRLEIAMLQQQRNHRILAPPVLHAGGGDTVVAVTEHVVSVPLQYTTAASSSTERIDVYFTIVEPVQNEQHRAVLDAMATSSPRQRVDAYVQYHTKRQPDLNDTLLYLQGGPGFGAPTPVTSLGITKGCGSWADAALFSTSNKYNRIVLMDQRGTGRSTPITKQTLELKFPALLESGGNQVDGVVLKEAVDYMAQFRADNIVQDAEYIREALLWEDVESSNKRPPAPWGCSLGQSFGGFCSMTYLSQVENPPRIMLLTGGIAPMLDDDTAAVYSRLWERVKTRNQLYYAMYPGDVPRVKRIVRKLMEEEEKGNGVRLPSGGRLTARRFLLLGISLGGSPSAFASMHELISTVFVNENDDDLMFSRAFLKQMDSIAAFDDHPIYYWMHESIYADGPQKSPTRWAAERALAAKVEMDQAFDYRVTSSTSSDDSTPVMFYGEHVFSWMSGDFAELTGSAMTALAQGLANKTDWGHLYNADHMRKVLQEGRTHAAAAVYYQDMFVDFDACVKVTAPGGPLELCKLYVTNEYQHSGLRDNGATIFSKLHGMATGGTRVPS